MKFLPFPARRALALALAGIVAILAILLVAASLARGPERALAPPRVLVAARGSGPLAAGAAEARFQLPEGAPIAGFARRSYASEGPPEPVGARALVLATPGCTVAIASAEIMLVPEELDAAVRARVADLGLTGVVLAATHTHAGPGGYWHHFLGERIATGPFDARTRDAIVAGIAEAIRRAAGSLAPARASVARGSADDLARSRSGGLRDAPLTVVRLDRPDGAPIAEVTIFAAHATMLGYRNRRISGDWPSRFIADGRHGLRLFLQGAVGDQSADGPSGEGLDAYASALSERVNALELTAPQASIELAFTEVELGLPPLEPGAIPRFLRRAARWIVSGTLPTAARVQAIRVGPALLAAVPAEPVAAVAAAWRSALPGGTAIVSLAGGYLGYVEAPERMAAGTGETVHTYYGPSLAARLGAALRAASEAISGGAPPGPAAQPRPMSSPPRRAASRAP